MTVVRFGVLLCCAVLATTGAARAAVPVPNDPRWPDQWALQNIGQQVTFDAPVGVPGADVNALEAWQWTKGAGAPPLAVIDSGVDFTHPDLVGAAWRNPGEIAGNGVDDDGDGHVDDVTGWNFDDDSADNSDPVSHGTGVAGAAAARSNDGIGIAGIAPETRVMSLRVEDDEGYTRSAPVAAALDYAADHGARVANVSLGMTPASAATLDAAVRRVPNLLVIAAAGNKAEDDDDPAAAAYPCALSAPNVVCVAATDARDRLARFSNFGAQAVDLAAPGDDVLTAVPVEQGRPSYGWTRGTSLAAPLVAGVAQLLLAERPELTTAELRAALLNTGTSTDSLLGRTVTGRRLDAAAALEAASGPHALPTPVTSSPAPAPAPTASTPDSPSVPASPSPGPGPTPLATPRAAIAGTARPKPRATSPTRAKKKAIKRQTKRRKQTSRKRPAKRRPSPARRR